MYDGNDNEDFKNQPYEIGYGKPPVEYQFKPGRSGNPKGRPKGSGGLAYKLRKTFSKVMGTKMETTVNGEVTKMEILERLVWKAAMDAQKGTSIRLLELTLKEALRVDSQEAERKQRRQLAFAEADMSKYKVKIEFVEPKEYIPEPVLLVDGDHHEVKTADKHD